MSRPASVVAACFALGIAANAEPVMTQMLVAPTGVVLRGAGGTPAATYYVVSSTDLTLAVSSWPIIATNQFDPAGNFDCTNTVLPADAQRYYSVRVPAPPSLQIIQAEDGAYTGIVDTQHSGYTGSGFVDTANAVGSYIEIEFGRQQAGAETMSVRYAHGKTDNRSASVMLNGATVTGSLAFPPTGSWTSWQYVSNAIPVVAGRNLLRLTALNSGGLANIDRFEITGSPQYKLSITANGNGIVTLSPSNAFNYYNPGAVVTLTATPLTGAVFTAWSGSLVSSNNPETIVMTTNRSVTAEFFQEVHFPIYVAPNGNDNNPGTMELPLYSLHKAVSNVVAGGTIYLRGGTYTYNSTVRLYKAGASNAPISLLAYPGERPVLDYSTWVPANETIRAGARGIHITTNAQWWVLKGLEIQYAPDNGIKSEGGHITFEQCVFHHNGDSGLQIGLNKDDFSTNPNPESWAAYNTVWNCDSYRNADPATSYENADGFACKLYAGKGNRFYGCRAWENVDDGWDCYQTEHLIVIENCWSWHNGDPTLWGFGSFNGDGNGFKLGGDNTYCPILVQNCVALNCNWGTTVGFAFNNNTAPITLYNCSALNCGRPYKFEQDGCVFKNCLDWNSTRPAPVDITGASTQQNNSWQLPVTVTAADFVTIAEAAAAASREPDGSLPNNGFARLVAGSDLLDVGVDVGLPYRGAAPDLGAFEFSP